MFWISSLTASPSPQLRKCYEISVGLELKKYGKSSNTPLLDRIFDLVCSEFHI